MYNGSAGMIMRQIFRRRIRAGRCLTSTVKRIAVKMSIVDCQLFAKRSIFLGRRKVFFGGERRLIIFEGVGAKRAKVRESVRLYRLKK